MTSEKLTNNSFITCTIHRKLSRVLLDTGSQHSIISSRFAETHDLKITPLRCGQRTNLFAANGSHLEIIGNTILEPRIKGLVFPIDVMVCNNLSDECLLGTDFISLYNVVLDYKNHIVILDDLLSVPLINSDSKQRVVRAAKCMLIPPQSEALIPITVHKRFSGKQILVEPMPGRQFDKFGVARSVNVPRSNESVCRILNYSESSLVLPKGHSIAFITECVCDNNIQPMPINRMSSEIIDKEPASTPHTHAQHEPPIARRT